MLMVTVLLVETEEMAGGEVRDGDEDDEVAEELPLLLLLPVPVPVSVLSLSRVRRTIGPAAASPSVLPDRRPARSNTHNRTEQNKTEQI